MAKKRDTMSTEVRAARAEIEKGLVHLGRSVKDIQSGLRQAERRIEADGRARVRSLRKEARDQLAQLRTRRSEATRLLRRLSGAAGGSWHDVKQAADRVLADARTAAESVIERFRRALQA